MKDGAHGTEMSVVSSFGMKAFSDSAEFNGFIDVTMSQEIETSIVSFLAFLEPYYSDFNFLIPITMFLRLFQIIGPSFLAPYKSIWVENSLPSSIVGFLSIIFHLFTPATRLSNLVYILYGYSFIILAFILAFIGSAVYFHKTAKISSALCKFFALFIMTIGYIAHPIVLEIISENASIYIANVFNKNMSIKFFEYFGFPTFLALFCFIIYNYFIMNFQSTTIQFRPESFSTLQSKPKYHVFILTQLLTVIHGLGTGLTQDQQIACLSTVFLIYILGTRIVYSGGGFIKVTELRVYLTCVMSGMVNIIISVVSLIMGRKFIDVHFFIFIGVFVVSYLISTVFIRRKQMKHLEILDMIESNNSIGEYLSSPSHFANVSITGFSFAHPVCISYKLCNLATQIWPENQDVYLIYAKYVSIYPEETRQLEWVLKCLNTQSAENNVKSQIMIQIKAILRQREANLSNELKSRLTHIMKVVENAKQKLRNIWDLILQGNIKEMNRINTQAYNAVERAQMELNRILQLYPNNRFVVRRYARFLLDIMADQSSFTIWSEKARQLQRGIRISQDYTYELGMDAFQLLPQTLSPEKNLPIDAESILDSETDIDEDSVQIDASEQATVFRKQIANLQFPSIRCTICSIIILVLLFIVFPSISLLIYSMYSVEDLTKPLSAIYSLSLMRNLDFQLQATSFRYVIEHIVYNETTNEMLMPPPSLDGYDLPNMGNSADTIEHLKALLALVKDSISGLSGLRTYNIGNPKTDRVREICFQNSIAGRLFNNQTSFTSITASIQSLFMVSVIQISKLVNPNLTVNSDLMNTPIILNPVKNMEPIAVALSEALTKLISFIHDLNDQNDSVVILGMISIPIFIVIVFLIEVYFIVTMMKNDRDEVFKCLVAIPKNVASSVADGLRNLSKHGAEGTTSTKTDSELNKQEENILKVFSSASDHTIEISGNIIIFLCIFVIIGSGILAFIAVLEFLRKEFLIVDQYCPHLDYLLGAVGYMNGGLSGLLNIVVSINGYHSANVDPFFVVERIEQRWKIMRNYYNLARYGGTDSTELPFSEFDNNIKNQKNMTHCTNQIGIATSDRMAYSCLNIENQFLVFEDLVWKIIQPYKEDRSYFSPQSPMLTEMWSLGAIVLYDNFFFPMFNQIIPTINQDINESIPGALGSLAFYLSVTLIMVSILLYHAHQNDKRLRFALNLMLHCPSSVILQTPKIMSVLSGDFSNSQYDTTNRDSDFFDAVVMNLPDSILCVDLDGFIESINISCERMLKLDSESFIGTIAKDFLNGGRFKYDTPFIFDPSTKNKGVSESLHASYHPENSNDVLNLHVTLIRTQHHSIVIFRDESQMVIHSKLIKEERIKSDQLLSAILPAKIVSRVQQGEKNISFTVECASIMFVDIVEFTPWCASNTASRVMFVLNSIFREFDAALAQFPTLTKIKCIGDCYMAAGGIFSEINQPIQHAKESIEFGLKIIEVITQINESLNENLRVRIGINTGGPIVAGVLGSEKPAFDILGPPINMAHLMEHHGIPMQIHISRSVYELVYGGNYRIKERGQIDLKTGPAFTYLILPKAQ